MKKNKSTKDKRSKTQNRLPRAHYYCNDYPRLKVLIYTCIYYLVKICFAMVSTMYVNIIIKKNNKIKTTTTKNKTKTKQNKKKCKNITQSEQFQILIDKM